MASVISFKDLAGNPRAWQEIAHDLVCSANILREALPEHEGSKARKLSRSPCVRRTLMMLYGLAAENFIKAIIVAKKLVSEGSFPKWFKNHDLPSLARRAGFPVAHSHEHLLKRLKEFVECGKYPVGLREGHGRFTWVFSEPGDSSDTLQLLEYLEEELQRASGGFVVAHPDLSRIHRQGA